MSYHLDLLRERADSDPNILGLVLSGSAAREGMSTERSDVDVYVVLADPSGWETTRTRAIDTITCPIVELRAVPTDPDQWYERYSFVDAQIRFDRSDGEIPALLNAWTSLTANETKRCVEFYLDNYMNYVYRSLKADRDGRHFERRMDAVESFLPMLNIVFALAGRVRPYNKYLRYELVKRPLDGLDLIALLTEIMDSGDPTAQRRIFAVIEPAARALGLGQIVDDWGDELALIRG